MPQDILARANADDLVEARSRRLQIAQEKFLRSALRTGRIAGGLEMRPRLFEQRDMPRVRDVRTVMQRLLAGELVCDRAPQFLEPIASRGGNGKRRRNEKRRGARRGGSIGLVRDHNPPMSGRLLEE